MVQRDHQVHLWSTKKSKGMVFLFTLHPARNAPTIKRVGSHSEIQAAPSLGRPHSIDESNIPSVQRPYP